MLARAWLLGAALLAAASARRLDHDFEFDDDAADGAAERAIGERHPRKYIYDPHSSLCRALVCKKREVCLLRDAYTALCANKKDVLRRGDAIVAARAEDDDVFYETAPDRCVGCGRAARARAVCGADNRTYSSLCRLELHNCVRRPAPPVAAACRGACPCPPPAACAPARLADRLLDWFSVLMERARRPPPPPRGFPAGCKPEVRWMFAHLDTDGDGLLSDDNLYALRHDERERCLRPFLSACAGAGGEGGAGLGRAAWCGCLRRAARPCAALARAARRAGRGGGGGWAPACDARGFYRPRQCHAALAECWCVDAHGLERPGSRTKGEPACAPAPAPAPAPAAPRDDEDAAGSGDGDDLYARE